MSWVLEIMSHPRWTKCPTRCPKKCPPFTLLWQGRKEEEVDSRLKKLKRFRLLRPDPKGGFGHAINAAKQESGERPTTQPFNELVVYSLLASRAKSGSGASVGEIVRATSLHKVTVNKALAALPDLVHRHNGRWCANEPPNGWFRTSDKLTGDHWVDHFLYMHIFVPRKGAVVPDPSGPRRFGFSHALVFSVIVSYVGKSNTTERLSVRYISKLLLGVNRKTVARVLADLRTLGIIDYEGRGVRLAITLQPLTDEHLNLFEPMVLPASGERPTATTSARPLTNKYEFKSDLFDEHRRLCEPLMVQNYAEQAIDLARRMDMGLAKFEGELVRARSLHDRNVKGGKCSFPNFGKFFVNRLHSQWAEAKRIRVEEEEARKLEEWVNSPEYKAAQAKRRKQAEADPLHPEHTPDMTSVLHRVKFADDPRKNVRQYEKLSRRLYRHCRSFIEAKKLGYQETFDATGNLVANIMKIALSAVNDHYGQETFANGDEFRQAIDDALVGKGLKPLFKEQAATK